VRRPFGKAKINYFYPDVKSLSRKYKVGRVIFCFCLALTATATAKLLKTNRNTINSYFTEMRKLIAAYCLRNANFDSGEFELDESYFRARRVRGKRGRGAAGKTPVFCVLKRGEKVFIKIVSNCSKERLMPVLPGKILAGSTIHTDGEKLMIGSY
jgi:transposase-like protein